MAKVKGPLFSLEAKGQIAKTLVYMGWKGLDTVRQYVIPTNPNTAKQQTQRGYFSDAVSTYQTTAFQPEDISAWNLLALAQKKVASGFNMFTSYFVKAKVASETFTPLANIQVSAITATGATISVDLSADKTTKIYYGTSKTNMRNAADLVFSVDSAEVSLTGLSASTIYYFYLINTAVGEAGRSGIYSFETIAA